MPYAGDQYGQPTRVFQIAHCGAVPDHGRHSSRRTQDVKRVMQQERGRGLHENRPLAVHLAEQSVAQTH
jgi:hypothetical protein